MTGPVREAAADHARLQLEVQPRGHHRVVETRHHDDLVEELVVRAAPPAQLLAQCALLVLGHVLDDQDFEVWPVLTALVGRAYLVLIGLIVGVGVPAGAAPVGVGGQRPVDPGHHGRTPVVFTGREQPAHPVEGLHTGKGPEPLDRREHVKRSGDRVGQLLDRTLLGAGQGQLSGCLLKGGPGIGPDLPQAVVGVRASGHGDLLATFLRRPGPAHQASQGHHLPGVRGLTTEPGKFPRPGRPGGRYSLPARSAHLGSARCVWGPLSPVARARLRLRRRPR